MIVLMKSDLLGLFILLQIYSVNLSGWLTYKNGVNIALMLRGPHIAIDEGHNSRLVNYRSAHCTFFTACELFSMHIWYRVNMIVANSSLAQL